MDDIVQLCNKHALRWTSHILERIFRRGISTGDVENALTNGKIIERYPNDYPFPSYLVLGYTMTGRIIHVVCGSNGVELWLITAYFPDPAEWSDDFKQRKIK